MSINKVVITGNLTRDPELRETPGGSQVLSFGVAVNDRRRNPETQQWEDCANFVDCAMFGNRAAGVARCLAKGSTVEVVVDEIELMTSRGDAAQPDDAAAAAFGAMGAAPVLCDEDVPF